MKLQIFFLTDSKFQFTQCLLDDSNHYTILHISEESRSKGEAVGLLQVNWQRGWGLGLAGAQAQLGCLGRSGLSSSRGLV